VIPIARIAPLLGALALILTACGGGDGSGGAGDGAAIADHEERRDATERQTTTTLSPEDEVLAAYERASDALGSAYDPPDPSNPDLLATYSGEALDRIQAVLTQLQGQGVSYVGTFDLHPTVVSVAGDTAVVEDCYIDHTQQVNTETREPIGEPGETVFHVEAHFERVDDEWMLVQKQELGEQCTPG